MEKRIAIVGIVGVPANYGGFETLAENLVRFHYNEKSFRKIEVYCSRKGYDRRLGSFLSARLIYLPFLANGIQSIAFDLVAIACAVWRRSDIILLGVSGAIALPLVRLLSCSRVVTNIDGIEWKRAKWGWLARKYLRYSERLAVKFSHVVIADNAVIGDYVRASYGVDCQVIAYGGEHAVAADAVALEGLSVPECYGLLVCRIEPENNVHVILEAFEKFEGVDIVIVGNWGASEYGRGLRRRYSSVENITLLDPIYDIGRLKSLRERAALYVHGHSAGGTNPSLVEAMHFGMPILAFDCGFNRASTEGKALYFESSRSLKGLLARVGGPGFSEIGNAMREIANRRYRWPDIAERYFELIDGGNQ